MSEQENSRARLFDLQGTDVPEKTEAKIQAALENPELSEAQLQSLCRSVAREIVASYPREAVEWNPTVAEDACIGCGVCVGYCKHGVYELVEGHARVVQPTGCVILCNHCEPECPVGAISFPPYRNYEELLANLRKNQTSK